MKSGHLRCSLNYADFTKCSTKVVRRKKLLVLVNPVGGQSRAVSIWDQVGARPHGVWEDNC